MTHIEPLGPERGEDLHDEVRKLKDRVEHARQHGERTIGQNVALIGSLGWLIVTPTVAGMFLGRWLDGRAGSGIFWTAACIIIGVSIGAWLAWARMKKEQE